jgi:hypothetical protein
MTQTDPVRIVPDTTAMDVTSHAAFDPEIDPIGDGNGKGDSPAQSRNLRPATRRTPGVGLPAGGTASRPTRGRDRSPAATPGDAGVAPADGWGRGSQTGCGGLSRGGCGRLGRRLLRPDARVAGRGATPSGFSSARTVVSRSTRVPSRKPRVISWMRYAPLPASINGSCGSPVGGDGRRGGRGYRSPGTRCGSIRPGARAVSMRRRRSP